MTKTRRKEAVVEMMKAGDWRAVLEEFKTDEKYREPLLVWIRPSLGCLEFIRRELSARDLSSVSSVGCGCGTLEWLLASATGLTVTGYEVSVLHSHWSSSNEARLSLVEIFRVLLAPAVLCHREPSAAAGNLLAPRWFFMSSG